MFLEIIIIFLLFIANGVFAMAEIAMVSSRKARLQQNIDEKRSGAADALELASSPNQFLSTVQIGITLIGTLAGALGGATLSEGLATSIEQISILAPYSHAIAFLLVVFVITYFSLVIGELIPKRLGLNNSEKIAMTVAPMMKFLARLASPLVRILSWSTDLGLRALGVRHYQETPVTEEEIKVLLDQGTQVGVFEEVEQDMVESVFRLSDRRVEAIMTPRLNITWLDLEEPYENNLAKILESRHSQFPVCRYSLDNIQGILVAKDLLRRICNKEPIDLVKLIHAPIFVPETTPALKVMEILKSPEGRMVLVVDEYGGVTGMVTLYDLLQAIVGEIPGVGEEPIQQVVQRDDGSWLVDGMMQIDEVKEMLSLDELPGEEKGAFQTLGGFIMSQLGNIPTPGQHFEWQNFYFEVMDMDARRVDKVLIKIL